MSFETSHIRAQSFDRAASLRGTLLPAPAGIGIGSEAVSSFLVWLKLWLGCVAEGILTDVFPNRQTTPQTGYPRGYQRPPSLLPDSARAAIAPQVLCGRRRRRILARLNGRGVPASRRYDGLQYLNDRQLTGNQFLERACRLSVNGRVGIYGLEYRLRLCQRRHDICACITAYSCVVLSAMAVSIGLSKFHLGPD